MSEDDLATMTIDTIIRRYPQTSRVFLDYKMNCPACLLSPFMTPADAAAEYGVDSDGLLDALRHARDRGDAIFAAERAAGMTGDAP